MSGNETTDAPRSLEELTKQCILLKPKLETHFFLELGDNPFHKLFRGTNQDIILTKYAHQSNSLSSLYQPPPSTHTGFSSQLFLQDNIEKWDGLVPGTQSENPLLSMRIAPFKDTPIVEGKYLLINTGLNWIAISIYFRHIFSINLKANSYNLGCSSSLMLIRYCD